MADEPSLPRLQDPKTRWALVLLALALLAGGSALLRRRGRAVGGPGDRAAVQTNIRREPAGPDVRAILAPLAEGSDVAGWRVTVIEGGREGGAHGVLRKGSDDIEVLIARRQGTAVSAPVTAGAYALFNMGLAQLDRQAGQVMRALADVLRANASAPMPQGMGPFQPGGGR